MQYYFCERKAMWNIPLQEQLNRIPRLYETENIPTEKKLIYLHFFIGGCDWYVAEYDGENLFFGFAILNNDYDMAEWGYISFAELQSINVQGIEIECETDWTHVMSPNVARIGKVILKGDSYALRSMIRGNPSLPSSRH